MTLIYLLTNFFYDLIISYNSMHLLKKLSNKDIKTTKKPWITKGILKSLDKKNKVKVYLNKKCYQKEKLCEPFKTY